MFAFLLGSKKKSYKINFEDMQHIINNDKFLMINTMGATEQNCLIKGTIPIDEEVDLINKYMNTGNINIVIYGKNTNDSSVQIKYDQLISLGFSDIYIYVGGMFEWLCLQDIYGKKTFPTTTEELDIIKYRPPKLLKTN